MSRPKELCWLLVVVCLILAKSGVSLEVSMLNPNGKNRTELVTMAINFSIGRLPMGKDGIEMEIHTTHQSIADKCYQVGDIIS